MNYTYTTVSKTGFVRPHNEDSIGVFKVADGILTIVCDGLGGNKAGEIASQLTVDTCYNFFKESPQPDFLDRIKSAVKEANRIVHKKSSSETAFDGMATTVEMLFLHNDYAYCGHVGDSRIYLYRNEKLIQVTKDHSFVQKLIDEGMLSVKEAEFHPNKNIITRALGDAEEIETDLSKINLAPDEKVFFLICTDGVTCTISNDELEEVFRLNDINIISQKIANLVEERGAPDNFSFVLIGN
jgi:serine/threonine protein phosphatase PrpC